MVFLLYLCFFFCRFGSKERLVFGMWVSWDMLFLFVDLDKVDIVVSGMVAIRFSSL